MLPRADVDVEKLADGQWLIELLVEGEPFRFILFPGSIEKLHRQTVWKDTKTRGNVVELLRHERET